LAHSTLILAPIYEDGFEVGSLSGGDTALRGASLGCGLAWRDFIRCNDGWGERARIYLHEMEGDRH
jgi:hypothetical protein